MFEGVPSEQFHQFIVSSRTQTPPPPPPPLSLPSLSFPNNTFTATFDTYQVHELQHNFLNHQNPPPRTKSEVTQGNNSNMVAMNLDIGGSKRPVPEPSHQVVHDHVHHQHHVVDPVWSSDEVFSLLRIRSSMENWFPDFTWEHVSRKLAELGFKRSPEECKEKFEEERRYLNNNNNIDNYNKINYNRVFSELEEVYKTTTTTSTSHVDDYHHQERNTQEVVAKDKGEVDKGTKGEEEQDKIVQNLQEDPRIDIIDDHQQISNENNDYSTNNEANYNDNGDDKKRKRSSSSQVKKFEMFKCFCQDIVHKLMTKQEEMHNKLIEDMVKRDEEKVAKEEAWKKQEMDMINKELELRAHEQALVSDRQATLIEFLKQFTSDPNNATSGSISSLEGLGERSMSSSAQENTSHPSTPLLLSQDQNPNKTCLVIPTSLSENQEPQNPNISTTTKTRNLSPNIQETPISSSTLTTPPQNPNSLTVQKNSRGPTSSSSIHNKVVPTRSTTLTTNEINEDMGKRWPRDEVLALINLRCSLINNSNADRENDGTFPKAPLWERISQGMLDLGYKRSAKRCKEKWENINKYFRKTKDVNKKRSIGSRTCPYFHQLSNLYNQGRLLPTPENLPGLPETAHSMSLRESGDGGDHEENVIQAAPPSFDFEF